MARLWVPVVVALVFVSVSRCTAAFVVEHISCSLRNRGDFATKAPPRGVSASSSFRHDKSLAAASISEGETVVVVGGTSGVGQLVTQKLVQRGIQVRATSRDAARGREILGDQVEVVALDLVGGSDQQIRTALQGAAGVVISVGTTAFPTAKWKGGNTPEAIDKIAVSRIARNLVDAKPKKVVMVTSVGIDRTKEMPFVILNLFGVLDAKKAGEEAIQEAAGAGNFDSVIVRPGRLVGGPFTNLDVARLLQIEGGAENGVTIQQGDSLLGDCKRDACAEAILQCLINDECKSAVFSIISNEDKALTGDEWTKVFQTI
jgi:nucleoside-diphosphate-sugar epimerase